MAGDEEGQQYRLASTRRLRSLPLILNKFVVLVTRDSKSPVSGVSDSRRFMFHAWHARAKSLISRQQTTRNSVVARNSQ